MAPGIVAVVKNSLYKPAIKQVIQDINVADVLGFKENLQECLHGTCNPKYLILDALAIPKPINFSLEKIITKNPDCLILIVNAEHFDHSAEPYVHSLIHSTDTDEKVNAKFKNFFANSLDKRPPSINDNTLSDREKEVVQLVAQGKTNKEISDLLNISPHTVIAHRKNITSKLGIKTIAGLAVYAVLNGLINPEEINK